MSSRASSSPPGSRASSSGASSRSSRRRREALGTGELHARFADGEGGEAPVAAADVEVPAPELAALPPAFRARRAGHYGGEGAALRARLAAARGRGAGTAGEEGDDEEDEEMAGLA